MHIAYRWPMEETLEHAESRAKSVSTMASEDGGRSLAGAQVLVVDDDTCVRRVLYRILLRRGAHVSEAASAAQAFGLLQERTPDLLISDINMPLEDGYSLMRRVRALQAPWAAELPAIALTGGGGPAWHIDAQRAGFNAYLTKPILPDVLIGTAASLLARAGGRPA